MRVIVKEPGKDPEEREIQNELEEIQKIVGGFIEIVRMHDDLVMVVNEEGLLLDLPYNFDYWGDSIVGTVIFCGETLGEDGGELCDLTDEQIMYLKGWTFWWL